MNKKLQDEYDDVLAWLQNHKIDHPEYDKQVRLLNCLGVKIRATECKPRKNAGYGLDGIRMLNVQHKPL